MNNDDDTQSLFDGMRTPDGGSTAADAPFEVAQADISLPAVNSVGDEVANAGASAAQSGASRQEAAQAAGRVIVDKPEAGEVEVVDTQRATDILFNFNVEDGQLVILDVDVIILFADGSRIILPGFAMMMVGPTPPGISFLDVALDPQGFMALIEDVRLIEERPQLQITSV